MPISLSKQIMKRTETAIKVKKKTIYTEKEGQKEGRGRRWEVYLNRKMRKEEKGVMKKMRKER